jgi:hypothetical protein
MVVFLKMVLVRMMAVKYYFLFFWYRFCGKDDQVLIERIKSDEEVSSLRLSFKKFGIDLSMYKDAELRVVAKEYNLVHDDLALCSWNVINDLKKDWEARK